MTLIAIGCTAAAVALLLPGASLTSEPAARPPIARLTPFAFFVAGLGIVALAQGLTLLLALICLFAVGAALRRLAARRRESAAIALESRVLEACELLAGELRTGQPANIALERCVDVCPELSPVATASRLGADVPAALRRLASVPGAAELGTIAAAWQVAEASGSGLAATLDEVVRSAREAQATRRLVAGELASARATARLVAALPLGTLLMGTSLGGDPWSFLLRTPAGLVCLAVGLVLAFVGLAWIDRIAAKVIWR